MRCKNCGSQNNDNLYICQNCGSPLYDEDEPIIPSGSETKVFDVPLGEPLNPYENEVIRSPRLRENEMNKEDEAKKKQVIIIIVLALVLIAIIAGTIIAVAHSKNKVPETTVPAIETSIDEETSKETTEKTTETTTTTTTQTTTETTTEETTTETTTEAPKTYSVTLNCNEGGEVEGDGSYELGENATVIARADDGYEFDGWYEGSKKVSSSESYTFTVTKDTNLKAVFAIVNDEPQDDGTVIGEDSDD